MKRSVLFLVGAIVVVASGCVTMPTEEDQRAVLVGTWVNPDYEGHPYDYYMVMTINNDLTCELQKRRDAGPTSMRLEYVDGRIDRSGIHYITTRSFMSIGEGYMTFRIRPGETLELVYGPEPVREVRSGMPGYRGVFAKE